MTARAGVDELARSALRGEPTTAARPAIRVVGLTKTFRLPHERRTTVKEHVLHPLASEGYEVLEALRDVSFDVGQGEWLGVVGRNGSGKSTLLRCLAGIYVPDSGVVDVDGRVAPFIDLGVGFNPELPARENVVQSAVLFGLEPDEAAARFDGILAFAELERFAGHKLKNYSTGMVARLAFAVAINVDADVLLFDEVLAVGDAAFKQKCLDHFERLREQGHAVVFVSHDLGSIERYCDRALLLHGGRAHGVGPPAAIAEQYDALTSEAAARTARTAVASLPLVRPRPRPPSRLGEALRRSGRVATHPVLTPLRALARHALAAPELGRSSMLGPDPRRFLLLTRLLAANDFRLKYAGTWLNYAWALAHPAALFGVLLLVFGHLGRFNREIEHYPAYLLVSIILWTFFSQAVSSAVPSFRRRAPLLRKLPVPRLAVPLSTILTAVFDLAVSLLVVLVFLLAMGIPPRLSWLELPLVIGAVGMFATGLGCLLSVLYVRFRDVDQIWSLASRVLFFTTPIFYVATKIPEPLREPLLLLNPLATAFTEIRHAVIDPSAPSAAATLGGYPLLAVPVAIAVGTLAAGMWAFARYSPRAAEYV